MTTPAILLIQLALPLILLTGLVLFPAASRVGYTLQALGTALFLFAHARIVMWIVLPWWLPWAYGAIWALAVAVHVIRRNLGRAPMWPTRILGWTGLVFALLLIATSTWYGRLAVIGGALPPLEVVDMPIPLGPGRYIVAHGGSHLLINGHMMTLDPAIERFRNWRGQSYALDLVAVDRFGRHSDGWQPEDPARYAIFGKRVHAPCAGEVIGVENSHRDMPVPEMDRINLLGNHVLLRCEEAVLLLAHLRQGSVRVELGQRVEPGVLLGEVGNSGNSAEPHLHLHAQRPGGRAAPIAGEPLALRVEGRYLRRNDRIAGRDW